MKTKNEQEEFKDRILKGLEKVYEKLN